MVTDVHSFSECIRPGTTVAGQVDFNSGGVARNVAECLMRLGQPSFLISVVGDDIPGTALVEQWSSLGLSTDGIRVVHGAKTPVVTTVFDTLGEIVVGVADTDAVEKHLTSEWILRFAYKIESATVLLLDANLHRLCLEESCKLASKASVPVWFEPVSVPKSVRATGFLHYVTYISPNENELLAMAKAAASAKGDPMPTTLKGCIATLLEAGVENVVLTVGSKGLLLGRRGSGSTCLHVPALHANVVSLSGAGDCLVSGVLAALSRGLNTTESMAHGVAVAKQAVESRNNVPQALSLSSMADYAKVVASKICSVDPDEI